MTGLLGNIWVVSTVLDQFFANRRPMKLRSLSAAAAPQLVRKKKPAHASAYLYLLLLSITDLISIAAVPLLVVDVAQSQWPFGPLACKLLFTFEGANKSLTPLVLMALSVDRYVAVCHGGRHRLRDCRYATGISASCIGVSLLFILPVALEATVTPLWDSNGREHVKCAVAMPLTYDLLHSLVCYVLPLLAICYVYAAILWKLYCHKEGLGTSARSRISLATVVKCSVMVVAFYFICWTPYWALRIFNMLTSFSWGNAGPTESSNRLVMMEDASEGVAGSSRTLNLLKTIIGPHGNAGHNNLTVMLENMSIPQLLSLHSALSRDGSGGRVGGHEYVPDLMVETWMEDSPSYFLMLEMYLLHALPYCQCALNWLFYAFLNRNLRQQSCTAKCAAGNETTPAKATTPTMAIAARGRDDQRRRPESEPPANPTGDFIQPQPSNSGGLHSATPRRPPLICVHYSVDGKSTSPPSNTSSSSLELVDLSSSRLISRREGICEIDWL
jgi:hypothetical protein